MVLLELQKTVNSLVKAGHGDLLMVKSRDEEGNGFEEISSLNLSASVGKGRDLDLVHPDDVEDYNPSELRTVICIW